MVARGLSLRQSRLSQWAHKLREDKSQRQERRRVALEVRRALNPFGD
jgi:hypothetical protein